MTILTPDERLEYIILKVEGSSLSSEDKLRIYSAIKTVLKALVSPILIKHMDKEELMRLDKNLDQVNPDSYAKLIQSAFKSADIYTDYAILMEKFLLQVENTLRQDQIIK